MEQDRHLRHLFRAGRERHALSAHRRQGAQRLAALVTRRSTGRVPPRHGRQRALGHLARRPRRRARAQPDQRARRLAPRHRLVAGWSSHRVRRECRGQEVRRVRHRRRGGHEARAHRRCARRRAATLVAGRHAHRLHLAPRIGAQQLRPLRHPGDRRHGDATRHARRQGRRVARRHLLAGWHAHRVHDERPRTH